MDNVLNDGSELNIRVIWRRECGFCWIVYRFIVMVFLGWERIFFGMCCEFRCLGLFFL